MRQTLYWLVSLTFASRHFAEVILNNWAEHALTVVPAIFSIDLLVKDQGYEAMVTVEAADPISAVLSASLIKPLGDLSELEVKPIWLPVDASAVHHHDSASPCSIHDSSVLG